MALSRSPSDISGFFHRFRRGPDRFSEGSFYGPAKMKAKPYRANCYAGFLAPFPKCLRFVRVRQMAAGRFVACLSPLRCPSHIARLVPTIIVNPVKSVVLRTWTQFRKEGLESFEYRRYGDPSAGVARIIFISRVFCATLTHALPRLVFGRAVHAVSGSHSLQNIKATIRLASSRSNSTWR